MRRLSPLLIIILVVVAVLYWPSNRTVAAPATPPNGMAVASFAGGCFWCTQHDFELVPGVVKVTAGYSGGRTKNASYEEVETGQTGHAESVEVIFDPKKISYARLLDAFWHDIDPLAVDAQFCDHGPQYRSVIFYHDAEQKRLAEESKRAVEAKFNKPVATQIVAAGDFWRAEEYHQDYWKKNPVRYKFYRYNCGRDQRLTELWGKAPE